MPIFSSLENMGEVVQTVLKFRVIECRKMNCLVELKIKSTTREIWHLVKLYVLTSRTKSRVRGHLTLYMAYLPTEDNSDAAQDTASGQTANEVGTDWHITGQWSKMKF